jgi:hypothetical protein
MARLIAKDCILDTSKWYLLSTIFKRDIDEKTYTSLRGAHRRGPKPKPISKKVTPSTLTSVPT